MGHLFLLLHIPRTPQQLLLPEVILCGSDFYQRQKYTVSNGSMGWIEEKMGARGKMESGALYLRRLRLEDGAVDELEGGGTGCSSR